MRSLLLVSVLLLAGCCGVDPGYVDADARTLETVGRPWLEYRRADDTLSRDEVRLSEMKIESWEARIEKARDE